MCWLHRLPYHPYQVIAQRLKVCFVSHLGRELLGLKWGDVDLEAGTLQARRMLTIAKGAPVRRAPKSKGSRRTVKLSPTALEALRSHLERQLGEMTGRVICGVRTASYSPQSSASR